jgi:flagellar hook-associated protein 1 FlgK
MSLSSALVNAQYGIRKAEGQLSVASSNIANADREGYTRKAYTETNFVSINNSTVASDTTITRITNTFLEKAVIRERTGVEYATTINEYMQRYNGSMGSTGGQNSINAAIDDLVTSIDALEQTPENGSEKINVINAAEDLAYQLNRQSEEIQSLRLDADQQIDQTIDRANELLQKLDSINTAIFDASARGGGAASLQDEQLIAIEELASIMDIQYHFRDNGKLQVYTTSGQILLGSEASTLGFVSTGTMTNELSYPDQLNGVTVNGITDITASIRGGELGALLELRDTTLPQEQAKLDALASVLMTELNAIHNDGVSIPAPNALTSATGYTGTESLAASTGLLRVAATDTNGTVIEFIDIDMATITDVNDLLAQINAMGNFNAGIDSQGRIEINAPAQGVGISMGSVDGFPVDVNGTGQSVSSFLGLNNFFDPQSSNASNIRVNRSLIDDPQTMSTGLLQGDPAMLVGDTGIFAGDSRNTERLVQAFDQNQTFGPAGDLAAQTSSFQGYMSTILSSAALRINNAVKDAENAQLEYDTTKSALTNFTGVNVDEELTNVTIIENAYASSAQVMSAVQEMFNDLLDAIR